MVAFKAGKINFKNTGTALIRESDLASLKEGILADGKVLLGCKESKTWELHSEVEGARLFHTTNVDALNAKLQNCKVDTTLWKYELTFKNIQVKNIIRFWKDSDLFKNIAFDQKTMEEM